VWSDAVAREVCQARILGRRKIIENSCLQHRVIVYFYTMIQNKSESKTQHYIAVNSYRTSTSRGFDNTWLAYRCSKQDQKKLLTEGLGVRGSNSITTMGIRLATASEIREMKRREQILTGMPKSEIYRDDFGRWIAYQTGE
jgi:hypothetical protein